MHNIIKLVATQVVSVIAGSSTIVLCADECTDDCKTYTAPLNECYNPLERSIDQQKPSKKYYKIKTLLIRFRKFCFGFGSGKLCRKGTVYSDNLGFEKLSFSAISDKSAETIKFPSSSIASSASETDTFSDKSIF